MCFINLQKSYDSVDQELLRVMLARVGVPEKVLTVIRRFRDDMQARVLTDDGEYSEWFDPRVASRMRHIAACFDFVFAAAIHTVRGRFIEDPDILRDLVHLNDNGVGGNAEPLDRARSAVWGVIYADDAGIVSKSAEGPCEDDDGLGGLLRSSGSRGVTEEDRNHAAADIKTCSPYLAARHRSSTPEV